MRIFIICLLICLSVFAIPGNTTFSELRPRQRVENLDALVSEKVFNLHENNDQVKSEEIPLSSTSSATYTFVEVAGSCLKIGVKSTGSFGRGNTTPGIQYNKDCGGVFDARYDFVTPQTPHEVLAVLLDGTLYADSNASCVYSTRSDCIRYSSNLVNVSTATDMSNLLHRGTRWQNRVVTKGTKSGLFTIENDIRFNDSDKIIEISTYITPLRNYTVGYLSRSVDSDAQIVVGDRNATYNKLGYSVVGSKYLAFSETWVSKAIMGVYTGEVLNTGAGIASNWDQSPIPYFSRKNDGNGDYVIGIAKRFGGLVKGREYAFRYSYVFGESAYKAVSLAVTKGAGGGTPGKVPGCTGVCVVRDIGPVGPTVTRIPTITRTPTPAPYDSGNIELCNSNCNFSSGMYGWIQSTSFDVSGDFVRSSPSSVRGTGSSEGYFYRNISVTSYASYIDQSGGTLNVTAYLDPGDSEKGSMSVSFLDATGTALSGGWESGWITNSREEWTPVSASKTLPVGTRSIQIRFDAKRTSGSYTDMNVDDVSAIARFRTP